ncbi:MAG TPA: putative selenate reductase subunit YgfK [Candidatus Rifleibacterium sp.]|nr:putative selenate reductase subunit YgfK [Candidatus Rifleibacterium sp.]HPT47331.1 putative selenate reductase subunit YgfK [Candidatus Rifleibacterium sp.]
MSKEFSRISIEHLASWILREYDETSHIFGIHKDLFFVPKHDDPFTMTRYGQHLESPIGVAAGPHTQMAQNLIAAWLCGSRYLELKTVQTLDELNVSKPCIDIQDEGYNCEWSQELRLDDSFDEYLNAWIMLHVLRHKFGWSNAKGRGFIFNMSVGYNLDGILKPNVQKFLERMAGCEATLKEKLAVVRKIYPKVDEIDIPAKLSDNITLSTMHGCPPDEIEKIAMYLVKDRGYHTTIKMNPTLLGAAHLRHILNEQLGFISEIPDEAFGHDLKYPDGVQIIKNLLAAAETKGVTFNLKLTNTLEAVNHKTIFPPNEKMMYMSGRALHPISVNVAARLQNEFAGKLDISFSAGADCFNLPKIIACGIKPVTVCSDILKPGGYARQLQYLEELATAIRAEKAGDIENFILKFAGCSCKNVEKAALINLRRYAGAVPANSDYHKDSKTGESVKTVRALSEFDCVKAPCISTCPAGQDIPSYMFYTAQGDYKKAYEVIMRNNPLPSVLGMVCDHQCQHKCTRSNYDSSLLIREVKRFIAARNADRPMLKPDKSNGKKVAIIGAGPSGLSAAYFLALEGFAVEVFETKAFAGGMIADAIPSFRLTAEAINRDVEYIRNLGVKISYEQKIDHQRFEKLRNDFDYVYVAIGAQGAKKMGIPGEDAAGVIDQLVFLSDVRQGRTTRIGPNVAVIGGGNSAMDAARTALRIVGEAGRVRVVYRRTRSEMPADLEEVKALLDEGIEVLELHQPLEIVIAAGKVAGMRCQKMQLGEKGSDGRRKPVPIKDAIIDVPCETVIEAIGQDVVLDFVKATDLETDPITGMTRINNVFAGGDAVRGASTIVKAVGDGQRVALNIIAMAGRNLDVSPASIKKGMNSAQFMTRSARKVRGVKLPEIEVKLRKGFATVVRDLSEAEAKREADRCLYCNDVCNVCVSVCPNRANRSYQVRPGDYLVQAAVFKKGKLKIETEKTMRIRQDSQVINIGDFCNECGNCTTFCPTAGDPYKNKPKFYLTDHSFKEEANAFRLTGKTLRARVEGSELMLEEKDDALHFHDGSLHARLHRDTFEVIAVEPRGDKPSHYSFEFALKMAILYTSLKNEPFNC